MFELFHAIGEPESAAVRRFIVEHGHKERVSFRNVSSDEARADFVAHGGMTTPALWDGERLIVGEAGIVGRLSGTVAPGPTRGES